MQTIQGSSNGTAEAVSFKDRFMGVVCITLLNALSTETKP